MRTEAVRSNIAPSRPITVRDPVFSTGFHPAKNGLTGKREHPGTCLLSAGRRGVFSHARWESHFPATRSRKTTALRPFASTSSK